MKHQRLYSKYISRIIMTAVFFVVAAAFLMISARNTSAAALPKNKGIYRICYAKNKNYVLDVMDGSRKMKANIQLHSWKNRTRMKFKFEEQSDGTFMIRNVRSGHVLTATGKTDGSRVYQYKANGVRSQRWRVKKNKDGTLSFINRKSKMALTIASGTPDQYVRLIVSPYTGKKTQKFALKKTTGKGKKKIDYTSVQYHRTQAGGDRSHAEWYFVRNNSHAVPEGMRSAAWLKQYNAYYVAPKRDQKYIYFTFDCGYENGYTPKILDVLKKMHVKGCFFVTGSYIRDNPEIVARMKREGHLVGNHTKSHPALGPMSMDQIKEELQYNEKLMKSLTGYKMDKIMRPPMGDFSEYMLAAADQLGYCTIFWSIAYYDYEPASQPGTDYVINHFNQNAHDRAITLTHAVSSSNTYALKTVIQNLKKEGYHFGSLDFLIK